VPERHLLRKINAAIVLVFADLHQRLAPDYGATGPSIDPKCTSRECGIIGGLKIGPKCDWLVLTR
jgi:hypothetical protein